MKKIFTFLYFLMLASFGTRSQAQTKPLKIGDQVPDFKITQLLNYKSPSLSLSDFKGKLLIIDFWATWCSPCVAMMSKTDSLQKQFSGRIRFLPVSKEDQKTVEGFLEKIYKERHIEIASACNDTILNSLFVHHYLPYYVWIDPNGKVIATTEAKEVNEKNIWNALNGESGKIKKVTGTKLDELDPKMPLFVPSFPILANTQDSPARLIPVKDTDILYQSVLSRYNPLLRAVLRFDSTHFCAVNAPVINLYRLSFALSSGRSPTFFWSKSRCKIEIKDSVLLNKITSDLVGDDFGQWLKTNGYNYELVWKSAKNWKYKYDLLNQDLDRYFGKPLKIDAHLEKRLVPADVLVLDGENKLKTSGGTPFEKHDAFSFQMQNMPLSRFISQLESYFWQFSDRPTIDETNFKGNVDIQINCKMADIDAVNKELARYHLRFINGERKADVLVITDK
jgi:thiol-disulfide isomerase/thioredoxin